MIRAHAGAALILSALVGGSCAPPQDDSAPASGAASPQTRPASRPRESGAQTRPAGGATMIQGDPMIEVLPRDAIPAIDAPRLVKASEAPHMEESEPVLGVEIGGVARAYPLYLLDHHEIVNDELGGEAIAATW